MVLILVLVNAGCTKMVEGYKKFHIQQFEEFFNLKSLEKQEEYIASGKLDLYEREEVLFIPFIKEVSETECALLLFVYSQNINNKVILNEVSLVTDKEDVISFTQGFEDIEVLSKWNDSMTLINVFKKSDEWFYNGNDLILNIDASIIKENSLVETYITYDVVIEGYKGTSVQV